MTQWTLRITATLLVTLLGGGVAVAEIPEPDHLFWGRASYFGEDLSEGEVTVTVNDDPTVLASYELGSSPELGPQFVLRVPMDSTGSRASGAARLGDLALFYVNGELAGEKTIGDRGTVTRLDIDPDAVIVRVVNIGDAQIAEGDAGQQELVFQVTLSEAEDFDVTVNYTTANETATTQDNDYDPENGAVEFAAGDTEATLSVTVNGDLVIESDETFLVNLTEVTCSGQEGCTPPSIGDGHGTGTILDDDTPPGISVADLSVAESDTTVQAIFRVSLSHVWDQDVSFEFATADGTAEAGLDYLSNSGSATIVQGSLSTTVAVDVLSDTEDEDNEIFYLDISNPAGGTILDGRGVGTILDDQNFLIYRGQQKNGTGGVLGLDGPWGVAVSSDGDHLYVASETDSVALFTRNETTGDLSFVEAISNGVNGVSGLDGARDVAVSPDGEYVYVVSAEDNAIVAFVRNSDDGSPDYGKLTLLQVLTQDQVQNARTIDGLVDASTLILGPAEGDVAHVYVVGRGEGPTGSDVGAVAVFERSVADGTLTYLEVEVDGVDDASDFGPTVSGLLGASDLALSPDGAHLYVTGNNANAVAVFERATDSTEPTLFGKLTYLESYVDGVGSPAVSGMDGASSVVVSADGAHVYVTGRGSDTTVGGLAHFSRVADDGDPDFGELTFVGSVAASTENGLIDAVDSALSQDGKVLYASAFDSSTLSVFRTALDGSLDFIEVKADGVGGVDGLAGAKRLAVSPDDRQVYASGTYDDAVVIFARDLDPPDNPPDDPEPQYESTSHEEGVWSGNPVISVEWSGAFDNGHSGLAGYSVVFDTTADTLPDAEVDVVQSSDPHSTSSAALAEGNSHYFHLRTCDNSDNCADAIHLGPFLIDLTAPLNPTAVGSDSHVVGQPSTGTRITMRWSGASDAASGVAGYGYTFVPVGVGDPAPAAQCTGVFAVAHAPGDIVIESAPLFNGRYYFQLCTQDAVGNWSAGITPIGPYIVQTSDAAAPTVTGVNTVASMDDSSLDTDDTVMPTVTQIMVAFSEAMFDTTDQGNPNRVRNVENYGLFAPGVNGEFDTVTCGDPVGDDQKVPVDTVVYDEASTSVALELNGGFALPPSAYRFVICDELVDVSGNNLDGDLNGTAGGEIVIGFEATSENLLLNPNFDAGDLSFWIDTPDGTADVAAGLGVDVGGSFNSHSAAVNVLPASEGAVFGVSQCLEYDSISGEFEISGWVRMSYAGDPGIAPETLGTVRFFTGALCDEATTGDETETNVVTGDTAGFWTALLANGTAPVDAASALVSFVVERDDSPAGPDTFNANFDDLYFGAQRVVDPNIFDDGFESGDLSGWSSSTP